MLYGAHAACSWCDPKSVVVCGDGVALVALTRMRVGLAQPSSAFDDRSWRKSSCVPVTGALKVNVSTDPPAGCETSPVAGETVMRSSSRLIALTGSGDCPENAASPLQGPRLIWYATLPSGNASSTPVTVTVFGVDQVFVVKFSDEGVTVPSARLLLATGIVTFELGGFPRATVKLAARPSSDVTSPCP